MQARPPSIWEQARMLTCKPSRARSVTFDLLRDRQKAVGVQRPPMAYLLPL
jgi:hypothetical protein